eukprot:1191704-Rhodomonas_salina.1
MKASYGIPGPGSHPASPTSVSLSFRISPFAAHGLYAIALLPSSMKARMGTGEVPNRAFGPSFLIQKPHTATKTKQLPTIAINAARCVLTNPPRVIEGEHSIEPYVPGIFARTVCFHSKSSRESAQTITVSRTRM